eukprot:scaffold12154_cov19-Tisochrysis_lutea.AAC.1
MLHAQCLRAASRRAWTSSASALAAASGPPAHMIASENAVEHYCMLSSEWVCACWHAQIVDSMHGNALGMKVTEGCTTKWLVNKWIEDVTR